MPLFLDVHSMAGPVTFGDVTHAHDADRRPQGPHGVKDLRYQVTEGGH